MDPITISELANIISETFLFKEFTKDGLSYIKKASANVRKELELKKAFKSAIRH